VPLDLLDNVFLLHLAFEPAQSVFEGFTLLQSDFSQSTTPPNSPGWDLLVIASFRAQVKGKVAGEQDELSFAGKNV